MAFDLLALSAVRIFMLWVFPQVALVIVLLVLTVGSVLFGTFCGDDITADGALVLLTCSINRIYSCNQFMIICICIVLVLFCGRDRLAYDLFIIV